MLSKSLHQIAALPGMAETVCLGPFAIFSIKESDSGLFLRKRLSVRSGLIVVLRGKYLDLKNRLVVIQLVPSVIRENNMHNFAMRRLPIFLWSFVLHA